MEMCLREFFMGKYIRLQKIGEGVQGKDNKAKEKIANFKIAKKIKLVKIFSSEKVKQGKIKVKYGLFARKLFLLPIGALSKKQESMEKELTIKHQVSNDKKEKQRIKKQKMKSLDIKKFTTHISRGGKIRKFALPARIGWSLSKKWELSSPKQNLAKPVNNKKTKQENNRKELRIKNRELRCVNKESQNLAEERKQKDWVVLDEKRGEKFALKKVKSDNIDVKPNTPFTPPSKRRARQGGRK